MTSMVERELAGQLNAPAVEAIANMGGITWNGVYIPLCFLYASADRQLEGCKATDVDRTAALGEG